MFYKKFDLSVYKFTTIYFKLFDIIMKKNSYNKDAFLDSKNITPSSYRRASKSEQKIGVSIIQKLSKTFNLQTVDNEEIDELELFLNNVYYDMYYKIYDNYNIYIEHIELLLSKNLILYPILNLFKLFLLANANNSPKDTISKYNDLYLETISFLPFYGVVFEDVADLVRLSFTTELTDELTSKNYNLGLHYFIIATKYWLLENYTGSLYYCLKAKQLFVEEENYIRVIYVNLTIMSNYNMIENYNECRELAQKQIMILMNLRNNGVEYKATLKHLMFSLLGLKKYDEVLKLLKNKKSYNITEMCVLLISKFKKNKDEYNIYYKEELSLNELDDGYKNVLENLHCYLINKDKRALLELENKNIGNVLLKILKKL